MEHRHQTLATGTRLLVVVNKCHYCYQPWRTSPEHDVSAWHVVSTWHAEKADQDRISLKHGQHCYGREPSLWSASVWRGVQVTGEDWWVRQRTCSCLLSSSPSLNTQTTATVSGREEYNTYKWRFITLSTRENRRRITWSSHGVLAQEFSSRKQFQDFPWHFQHKTGFQIHWSDVFPALPVSGKHFLKGLFFLALRDATLLYITDSDSLQMWKENLERIKSLYFPTM